MHMNLSGPVWYVFFNVTEVSLHGSSPIGTWQTEDRLVYFQHPHQRTIRMMADGLLLMYPKKKNVNFDVFISLSIYPLVN